MDVDFISLLEDEETCDVQRDGDGSEFRVAEIGAAALEVLAPQAELAVVPVVQPTFRARARYPQMKGKVGKGRHGGFAERSLLTCHMSNSAS